jgi:hypothetical protein
MAVLITGEGLWDHGTVSGLEWFRRMRRLLVPSRCMIVRADTQEPALRPNDLMFEMQSPREREARMCRLAMMLRAGTASKRSVAGSASGSVVRASGNAGESPLPVPKELVQADWERWLRRNRLW